MNKQERKTIDNSIKNSWCCEDKISNLSDEYMQVTQLLKKFQEGYVERNLDKAASFVKELFVAGDRTIVLGTGTQEVFVGTDQITELIKGDWEGWGDVNIELEKVHISRESDICWFAAPGSVKYSFQDTTERYDSYADYIKSNIEAKEMSAKQKIAFLNWALALTYHQRGPKEREYLWPLCISGILLKQEGTYKITQLHFSISRPDFPDERFENLPEYVDSYRQLKNETAKYKSGSLEIRKAVKELLFNAVSELSEKRNISEEVIARYFLEGNKPYVIGTQNELYSGISSIAEYFSQNSEYKFEPDMEDSILLEVGKAIVITITGLLKKKNSEEKVYLQTIDKIRDLVNSSLSSEQKIFSAKRSLAYALKETASGEEYTYPIRLTAVVVNSAEGLKFQNMHFSFPFYWIFEGKLDDI